MKIVDTPPDPAFDAPDEFNWKDYTTTKNNIISIIGDDSTNPIIEGRMRNSSAPMPPVGLLNPTTPIELVEQWKIDGTLKNAAPTITTGSATTNTTNGSITLEASVFANGLPTTFLFQWIEGDGSLDWNAVVPTNTASISTSSTGGGNTAESVSVDIPVLKCNTTYQYRSQATNSTGSSPFGSTRTVPIGACTTLDADGDGWLNDADNCPNDANPEDPQENLDGDLLGDVCDDDIDGDGVSNAAENAIQNADGSIAMDPRDENDAGLATLDFDGDGQTNIDEFNNCTNLGVSPCDAINSGLIPPVISLQQSIIVTATGYLTAVDLDVTTSGIGTVNLKSDPSTLGSFRPGHHQIIWTATDEDNFESMVTQVVDVLPLVRLGGSQVTGEGRTISVPVVLNGNAPTYPVSVNYTVTGTADSSDFNPLTGTLDIITGTNGVIDINILSDITPEPDEDVLINLTGVSSSANAMLSNDLTHTVVITERNIEPSASIRIEQSGSRSSYVYTSLGEVTITANAIDPNDDSLTIDWSFTDAALRAPATNSPSFTIAPATLTTLIPGNYQIVVLVSDGINQITNTVQLVMAIDPPILSATQDTDGDGIPNVDGPIQDSDGDGINDAAEGRTDSDGDGLPDYIDPIDDPTLLNSRVLGDGNNNASRAMMTDAGLSLALGDTAITTQAPDAQPMKVGAQLFASDVKDASGNIVTAPGFTIVSGVYDFEIRGLSDAQRIGRVVIPLSQSIPTQATFLKFSRSAWTAFVETATDGIRSAKSDTDSNECPPPGDSRYQAGLIAFNDCLELTLTDGGPNDADGEANGVIKDPGAVTIPASTPTTTSSDANSSPGGAGAFGVGWLLMLSALLWLPRRFKQGEKNG
ncbi:MAG: choice-of-anchor U domain-containing protein [Gammaproteobacteria bacterium]